MSLSSLRLYIRVKKKNNQESDTEIYSLCTIYAVESAPTSGSLTKQWRPQCSVLDGPGQLLQTQPTAAFVESVHLRFGLPLFLLPVPGIVSGEPCLVTMRPK